MIADEDAVNAVYRQRLKDIPRWAAKVQRVGGHQEHGSRFCRLLPCAGGGSERRRCGWKNMNHNDFARKVEQRDAVV
jgi:hypothetical protein